MAIARTIIEEEVVTNAIAEAKKSYPRIEEVFDAWKWRLARDPGRDAQKVGNPGAYVIKTPDLSDYGLPKGMTFIYNITDNDVTILNVRIE